MTAGLYNYNLRRIIMTCRLSRRRKILNACMDCAHLPMSSRTSMFTHWQMVWHSTPSTSGDVTSYWTTRGYTDYVDIPNH